MVQAEGLGFWSFGLVQGSSRGRITTPLAGFVGFTPKCSINQTPGIIPNSAKPPTERNRVFRHESNEHPL